MSGADQRTLERDGLFDQARERSLRLLDFLDEYYAQRYPPVYDIADYRDFRVGQADLPPGGSAVLSPDGGAWLTVTLPDLPPPPAIPDELRNHIAEPVGHREPPVLRFEDAQTRKLLALYDAAEVATSEEADDLDLLDEEKLAELGLENLSPSEVADAVLEAAEERERLQGVLERWTVSSWQPWSERVEEIELARAFFKQLFNVRSRMERERDIFELVWGFGRLRWRPASGITVDHPLVTVPAEIVFDQSTNSLTVVPAGAPIVESSWTANLPLSDRARFGDERTAAEEVELNPWGSAMADLLERLLRCIDLEGHVVGSDGHPAPGAAILDQHEWVLYLRRRQPNYKGFLEAQRDLYARQDTPVPAPFAALVVDEPSALDPHPIVSREPAAHAPATAERMLLPLEANEEQMRILTLAQERVGVTAQGPPGTGKSHTIANLISHYVAHGQRVLVTAEKEQALRVLVDKVPEDIRTLCVPVLGADRASRDALQHTITAIVDAAHQAPDLDGISRLETELDQIESRLAATTERLKQQRAAEADSAPLPQGGIEPQEWTPSRAAQWVAERREQLDLLPDGVGPDAPPPISSAELAELIRLCREVDSRDGVAALRHLPDPADLPTGGALADLFLQVEQLEAFLGGFADHVLDWERVDAAGPDTLRAFGDELADWATRLAQIEGSWARRVLDDAGDPAQVTVWEDFCRDAAVEREAVLAANRQLAANVVTIETTDPSGLPGADLQPGLAEARQRFAAGKKIGMLQRDARRALDICRVDGRVPSTVDDLDLIGAEITRRTFRARLATRWTILTEQRAVPPLAGDRPVEEQIGEHLAVISTALDWRSTTWPGLHARLVEAGVAATLADASAETVQALVEPCRALARRAHIQRTSAHLDEVRRTVDAGAQHADASELWHELREALDQRAVNRWDEALAEASRLSSLRPAASRRADLLDRVRTVAPLLGEEVAAGTNRVTPDDFERAWAWRQLDTWLRDLDEGPEPGDLQSQIEQLAADRRRVTAALVSAKAWAALSNSIDDRRRAALNRFTTANQRIGKGTGRYAPVWEAEMRRAMDDAKDAVPVWIMPIHKAIASFRPSAEPPFDVIIVDEASQVGILEVPVLSLARRAIVVGDDKQTSPENVGVERQQVYDLIDAHLGSVKDRRTRFDPDNSLYDMARQRFPDVVPLREHFRCLPRIIGFSSRHWYNDSIVPLRDRPPRPGWQPLGTVFVPGGTRRRNDDTNMQEATAVVDLIEELIADPDYDGMTFGVISLLGSGQAPRIQSMMLDRLGPSTMEERQIRVGDPSGFQGDERDVVVLSMVVAHEPGRRIGAQTTAAAARRVNVAASRAKNQLWLVHSVGPESLVPDDPRRALLEHCLAPEESTQLAVSLDRAESEFERSVLRRIYEAGYTRVIPQYPVAGYRIDIVVEGPEGRLAVECDGDRWHGPDQWDRDRARQAVLERAGWTFERIRGSAYFRDPNAALERLWRRLEELRIPKGDWAGELRNTAHRRVWPDDFPQARTRGEMTLDAIAIDVREEESRRVFETSEAAQPTTSADDRSATRATSRTAVSSAAPSPSASEVRRWARARGLRVGERGRLAPHVIEAWNEAHPDRPYR